MFDDLFWFFWVVLLCDVWDWMFGLCWSVVFLNVLLFWSFCSVFWVLCWSFWVFCFEVFLRLCVRGVWFLMWFFWCFLDFEGRCVWCLGFCVCVWCVLVDCCGFRCSERVWFCSGWSFWWVEFCWCGVVVWCFLF